MVERLDKGILVFALGAEKPKARRLRTREGCRMDTSVVHVACFKAAREARHQLR